MLAAPLRLPCAGPSWKCRNRLGGRCYRHAGCPPEFQGWRRAERPAGHLVLSHRPPKDRLHALSQQRTFSAALTNSANFFRA
jgi:hypothetical protein